MQWRRSGDLELLGSQAIGCLPFRLARLVEQSLHLSGVEIGIQTLNISLTYSHFKNFNARPVPAQ